MIKKIVASSKKTIKSAKTLNEPKQSAPTAKAKAIADEQFIFDLQHRLSSMQSDTQKELPAKKYSTAEMIAIEYEGIERSYRAKLEQARHRGSIYEAGLQRRLANPESENTVKNAATPPTSKAAQQ